VKFVVSNTKNFIKIIISLCLFVYLTTLINWDIVFNLNYDFSIYVIVSVLIALLFLGFMAIRWTILIASFSNERPKFSILYRYYLLGSFFNVFFPGAIGGDIMRIHYSNKKYHLGIQKATAIILFERISGLIGLSLIFSFSIFFNHTIADHINIDKQYILLFPFIVWIVNIFVKKISYKKGYTVSYRTINIVIFLSILGQFADIFIAYILCYYFHLPITLGNLLTIMPLVYIVTVLPISLGGIGVREGAFVGLLALYGVGASTAVIISFLMYFIRILIGVIGWIVYLKEQVPEDNL